MNKKGLRIKRKITIEMNMNNDVLVLNGISLLITYILYSCICVSPIHIDIGIDIGIDIDID